MLLRSHDILGTGEPVTKKGSVNQSDCFSIENEYPVRKFLFKFENIFIFFLFRILIYEEKVK